MCSIAAAGLAVSAISTVSDYMGQQDAADQQERQNAINAQNAQASFQIESNALADQENQVKAQASGDAFDLNLDSLRAASAAKASAADAGVSGLSVDRLIADVYAEEGRAEERIRINRDNRLEQIANERAGAGARRASRSQGVPVTQPSLLGAGAGIAGAAIDYAKPRRKGS